MKLINALNYAPVELSFGTSGLRGLATEMTDLECYINTLGFLKFLQSEQGLVPNSTVYLAGDLRESTPRILTAVIKAVSDSGCSASYCGHIPTPALAYYAASKKSACIMVTGSHIPADRNGIKFYKQSGELLKNDENLVKHHVKEVREQLYSEDLLLGEFNENGSLKDPPKLPDKNSEAETLYIDRYLAIGGQPLRGKHIILYEHSAVGRELLANVLERLGADVAREGRSDIFIPIDTENVTPDNKKYFRELAAKYPDNFAIISTDGDSDRPFVIDESGQFHRGDMVGCVVADALNADFAAVPISANDAVDIYLKQRNIKMEHTKIGSPYVIDAMIKADKPGSVVGWEVNGGFLLNTQVELMGIKFDALPTRDAFLPILGVLLMASKKSHKLSEVFDSLPRRFTGGALLDGVNDSAIQKLRNLTNYKDQIEGLIYKYMKVDDLGEIAKIDFTDGVRVSFDSGDVIHIRPSGNAPQLRIYTNCRTQKKADELAINAIKPSGLLNKFVSSIESLTP